MDLNVLQTDRARQPDREEEVVFRTIPKFNMVPGGLTYLDRDIIFTSGEDTPDERQLRLVNDKKGCSQFTIVPTENSASFR